MKLSISNIAWPAQSEREVFSLLHALGIRGLEVAPTRLWPEWNAGPHEAAAYRAKLAQEGIACSSLQAVLFGKPELRLFTDAAARRALLEHLTRVADIAAALGAGPVVFGAPRNRDRGTLSDEAAFDVAMEFFGLAGREYAARGVCLCIEPNPEVYGCNFVTRSDQGVRLVRAVASPGFRLHLDAAGMHLAGEDAVQAIIAAADVLEHVHISEPQLGDFSSPQVDHHALARALRSIGWKKWMAIEMKETRQPLADVRTALERATELYGA
jgi:D-psicose/D-tagatose/L-ribulose 3-epimerase